MSLAQRIVALFSLVVFAASPAFAQQAALPAPGIPTPNDAPIALLVDAASGQILHARNADRRFVPASITKAMTIFHAFELIDEGQLDPRQTFTIRPTTWREWAGRGSTMWLGARDEVLVDELLLGIANVSANDGSAVLAEGQAGSIKRWTAGMNARARELGMTNSHFGTPNGWPDDGGTFTSARDLVALARAMTARHPTKFAHYVGRRSFTFNDIEQFNHDPLVGRVAGADGIKTGYTNEAGFGYLGTAKRNGRRLIMVVAGSPRDRVRDRAARSYIEWGFSAFEGERLFAPDTSVARARVQRGSVRNVDLVAAREVRVSVPKGTNDPVRMSVRYDGPLIAPIEAGEKVAVLVIEVPGMTPTRVPLVAAKPVSVAGPFLRVINGIAGWLS